MAPAIVAARCTAPAADSLTSYDDQAIHDESLPCRIAIQPTGVVLASDIEGTIPDPMGPVFHMSDGRYLTRLRAADHELGFWSAEGEFLRAFGRHGEGPSELSRFDTPILDRTDTIHTWNTGLQWKVFDPEGNFVRVMLGARFGSPYWLTRFLDDGRVLGAEPIQAVPRGGRFHISSRRNEGLKTFGEGPPGVDMKSNLFRTYLAYGGGETFWAVSPMRYRLEQWDTAGVLRQVVDPEPEWFEDGPELRSGSAATDAPVPDQISAMVVHDGLLWVSLAIAKDDLDVTMQEHQMAMLENPAQPSPWTRRIEVYDADSGALLASAFYPQSGASPWSRSMQDGSGLGWRSVEQPSGLRVFEIFRFGLAAR